MKKIQTLFRKEFLYYLNNPLGYIAAILFAAFANFLFIKDLFIRGDSSMRPFFDVLPWLLLVFIPAVCMRLFADEKKTGTLEVLQSLPITTWQIVIGKFLAGVTFCTFSLLMTISIPLTLSIVSNISWGEIVVSYIGAIGLIMVFVVISLFFSSLTKHQVVAFLTSVIALFFLLVLGGEFLSAFIPQSFHAFIISLSPFTHYLTFLKG
jgi:ABC-2 type transport system permease protein